MNTVTRIATLGVLATTLALTGCGKSEQTTKSHAKPAAAGPTPSAATPAAEPKKIADGNSEREQGTMEIDAGKGSQSLRSVATVIDPKLGEKTAARPGTSEGQKTLANANANANVSVPSSMGVSGTPKVTTSDIHDMANSFAGRTVYSSQVMHAAMIDAYIFELDAKSHSEPGVRIKLNFTVSDKDLKLLSAKLEYYPNANQRMQSLEKKMSLTDITIDKLERKDEKTFVVSGSFKTTEVEAGILSKELKGQTLASVSGRFDFSEVPIRQSGI